MGWECRIGSWRTLADPSCLSPRGARSVGSALSQLRLSAAATDGCRATYHLQPPTAYGGDLRHGAGQGLPLTLRRKGYPCDVAETFRAETTPYVQSLKATQIAGGGSARLLSSLPAACVSPRPCTWAIMYSSGTFSVLPFIQTML